MTVAGDGRPPSVENMEEDVKPVKKEDAASDNKKSTENTTFKFRWELPNFSEHKEKKIYSNTYVNGEDKWRLLCFPRGNNTEECSVYLDVADSKDLVEGWSKIAQFTLSVINQLDEKKTMTREAQHRFHSEECDWGFSQFIKQAALRDPNGGFLVNDTLILECEVMVVRDPALYSQMGIGLWYNYDSKKETGFVGLKNQGATCYMNSLLQTMFFTSKFRKAVYQMPMDEEIQAAKSVALALQRVFYNLQYDTKSVGTKELTKSFGWDVFDAFTQHDVQELSRVLCDNLETKMKGTKVEGTIENLFNGELMNFIKCVNVDYQSTRIEPFSDLSLNVKGAKNIMESFDEYTIVEKLDGENKYRAEGHGLQDATKGILFKKLPPVLHIQLKRFEYDPIRDATAKVNDRHEFYDRIDLTKYMSDDADKSVRQVYVLHSVLVHSGDLSGGHYYGFIRPNMPQSSDWYRFDDDRVMKATEEQAMSDNFGGEEETQFMNTFRKLGNTKRFSNAYMLVYVREDDLGDVLCPVDDDDIPKHLRDRFDQEKADEERKKRDKAEAHLYTNVKVVTTADLKQHSEADLVKFDKIDPIRVLKTSTLMELKKTIQEKTKIPISRQRFWTWVTRQNKTHRPELPISLRDEEMALLDLYPGSQKQTQMDLKVLLEEAPSDAGFKPFQKDQEMLLFFKYYDPHSKTLSYAGQRLCALNATVGSLVPFMNKLMNFPSTQQLVVYEEVRPSMIDELQMDKTLQAQCELENGDILCFQKAPPPAISQCPLNTVPEYFHYFTNKVDVQIRKLSKPKETEFTIELSKVMKYDEVATRIAEKLNCDPMFIRLTGHQSYTETPKHQPIRRSDKLSLADMLTVYTPSSDILYYEPLEFSIVEMEAKRLLKISWYNSKTNEDKSFSILLAKDAMISDVHRELKGLVPLESTKELRIMEVWSHKITKIIPESDCVSQISEYASIRAEEIQPDELDLQEGDKIIPIGHVTRDHSFLSNFGVPFVMKVSADETLAQFKPRVQKRLGVPDEEFSKWKFWYVCYNRARDEDLFKDNDRILSHEFNTQQDYLGLEHADNTPKQNKYNVEKPIMIYN